MDELFKALSFKDGLIPAIIVDDEGGEVLTLCYMNEEALRATLQSGQVHVFRRSKGRVMLKGETSGHTQSVREVRIDCAGNSLLIRVLQKAAACHTGYKTCYYRRYDAKSDALQATGRPVFNPDDVYK